MALWVGLGGGSPRIRGFAAVLDSLRATEEGRAAEDEYVLDVTAAEVDRPDTRSASAAYETPPTPTDSLPFSVVLRDPLRFNTLPRTRGTEYAEILFTAGNAMRQSRP